MAQVHIWVKYLIHALYVSSSFKPSVTAVISVMTARASLQAPRMAGSSVLQCKHVAPASLVMTVMYIKPAGMATMVPGAKIDRNPPVAAAKSCLGIRMNAARLSTSVAPHNFHMGTR